MLWLPTAAAELRHVIRLRYIRPVWMNNEECLSLQNIPASLLLPRALLLAQTVSCWATGTGAVGREGGETGEHRGDWRKTGAPLTQVCSEKGGFFWGENYSVCSTRNVQHSTNICVLWVTGYFPKNCVSEPWHLPFVWGTFYCQLEAWIHKSSIPFPQTSSVTIRENWLLFLSALFKETHQGIIPVGFCQCLHLTCQAEHLLGFGYLVLTYHS